MKSVFSLSLTNSLSLSLFLSLSRTHTRTHPLSHFLSLTLTFSPPISFARTRTLTQSLSLSIVFSKECGECNFMSEISWITSKGHRYMIIAAPMTNLESVPDSDARKFAGIANFSLSLSLSSSLSPPLPLSLPPSSSSLQFHYKKFHRSTVFRRRREREREGEREGERGGEREVGCALFPHSGHWINPSVWEVIGTGGCVCLL